ncbi:MAG: hypothetical protein BWY11_02123 [Firmicutes bacterium ADurb.Bin182]|nr:MAG: hypothetical protein BWY11_02123 [Firmicutes bacterium ADurb.Bin182]
MTLPFEEEASIIFPLPTYMPTCPTLDFESFQKNRRSPFSKSLIDVILSHSSTLE